MGHKVSHCGKKPLVFNEPVMAVRHSKSLILQEAGQPTGTTTLGTISCNINNIAEG